MLPSAGLTRRVSKRPNAGPPPTASPGRIDPRGTVRIVGHSRAFSLARRPGLRLLAPMRVATTASPLSRDNRFPPGIPYIVGNEAAERFSFYGLRQILYIYLVGLFVGFASEHTVPADLLADAKVRATQ